MLRAMCLVLALAAVAEARAGCRLEDLRAVRVGIFYHTLSNHTRSLAMAIRDGAHAAGAEVRLKAINQVDVEEDVLNWADGICLGAPTHYGNVASALTAWLETKWTPFWQDARFDHKVGGAFTTAGGMAQGLEHVITSLHRALQSFRITVVSPSPTASDYASYGAVAVTGKPFASNSTGGAIAAPFVEAAELMGRHLTQASQDALARRICLDR